MKFFFAVFTVLFLSVAAPMKSSADELPGTPVFEDDFSVLGLFAEHWESTKGAKCEKGKVSIPWKGKNIWNSITLRRIPKGDYAFTFDVALEKPTEPKTGFFGIKLDGWINLLITPSRTEEKAWPHTAYKVGNEKHARGKGSGAIPGFKFGTPVKVMVSRKKVGNSYNYVYKVNGRLVDSFIVPFNKKGTER